MKRHHPLDILVLAFALAFAFALLFLWVEHHFVEPHGPVDPSIFRLLAAIAGIAAVITYPFLYFALRERKLPRATIILAGVVVTEILIVTPIHPGIGFWGSFVAYFIGLFAAQQFSLRNILPGHCQKCAYNLQGIPLDHACPECGTVRGESE